MDRKRERKKERKLRDREREIDRTNGQIYENAH